MIPLPFIGGQVTAEELQRGEIKHVIGIALVQMAGRCWPALRGDASGNGIIPQGARFRLDPSIDLAAMSLHRIARVIGRAAQRYGFVVWDGAGAVSIRLQNPYTYGTRNPYVELFGASRSYELFKGFPWDRLQFMPQDYGRLPI